MRTRGSVTFGLSLSNVPGASTTTPAFRSPMNAIKRPIPTAIPFFRLGLTPSIMAARMRIADRMRKRTPAMNVIPRATFQDCEKPAAVRPMTTETKKKFSPMPGACAMG